MKHYAAKKGFDNLKEKGKSRYEQFQSRREVSSLSKELKSKGKELARLQKDWAATLEGGNLKHLLKSPRRMIYGAASRLPGKVGDYFEEKLEEGDPFNLIEEKSREYLESIEDILLQMGQLAKEEKVTLQESQDKYEEARADKWDALKLREYIHDSLGKQVDTRVEDIFADLRADLSPQQAEKKRKDLLKVVGESIGVQEEIVKLLSVVAKEGMEIYDKALMQYYGFARVKQQLQMYRDANIEFATTEALSLDTKDMVVQMVQSATKVADVAITSLSVLDKNMVASKDTQAKIAAARKQLSNKLEKVLSGEQVNKVKEDAGREKVKA